MTVGASPYADVPLAFWKQFWWRFTRHEPKYANAVTLVLLGSPADRRKDLAERFDHIVKTDQAHKFAGLYVDVIDGVVVSPSESVTEADVSATLSVLNELIRGYSSVWSGTNFLDMFREGLAGGGRELAEARDRGDWQRVDELFRELDASGEEPES